MIQQPYYATLSFSARSTFSNLQQGYCLSAGCKEYICYSSWCTLLQQSYLIMFSWLFMSCRNIISLNVRCNTHTASQDSWWSYTDNQVQVGGLHEDCRAGTCASVAFWKASKIFFSATRFPFFLSTAFQTTPYACDAVHDSMLSPSGSSCSSAADAELCC